MLRKYMSLALIGLLLNFIFYSTAAADTDRNAKLAEKIKAAITRFSTDNGVRITVKLKDGTKSEGYISSVKDSGFVLKDANTETETEIQYSQVRQVGQNKRHNNSIALVTLKVVLIAGLLGILGGAFSNDY